MGRPLCKNCAHFAAPRDKANPYDKGMCLEPDNNDPITGEAIPLRCYDMRNDLEHGRCGFDGHLFTPKKPASA